MKRASYTLTILMSIFLIFTSCSDEEIFTSPEINSNLEILDFSFLEDSIDDNNRNKEENIIIINRFLNNFDRVLTKTPINEFIEDSADIEMINEGMSTLILSDKELYNSFLALKQNKISINDIQNNIEKWNNSSRDLCIPSVDACLNSIIIYSSCGAGCPGCCLAIVGVNLHCCSGNQL